MGKLVGSRKCFARGPFGDVDISMVKRENFGKWWKEFASNLSYFLGGIARFFEPREEGDIVYGIEGYFEVRERKLSEIKGRLERLSRVEKLLSEFPYLLEWRGELDLESFHFRLCIEEFEMNFELPGMCMYFKDEGEFFSPELERVVLLPLSSFKIERNSDQILSISFGEWLNSCRKHFEEELKKLQTSVLIKEKQKTKRELIL